MTFDIFVCVFFFLKQKTAYEMRISDCSSDVCSSDLVEGLDDKTRRKVDFYTRQFVDAMAPSNFIATNPEVLRATLESHGANLVKGLENLIYDLERGRGGTTLSMPGVERRIGSAYGRERGCQVVQSTGVGG